MMVDCPSDLLQLVVVEQVVVEQVVEVQVVKVKVRVVVRVRVVVTLRVVDVVLWIFSMSAVHLAVVEQDRFVLVPVLDRCQRSTGLAAPSP
jgi:hypothetical protein